MIAYYFFSLIILKFVKITKRDKHKNSYKDKHREIIWNVKIKKDHNNLQANFNTEIHIYTHWKDLNNLYLI